MRGKDKDEGEGKNRRSRAKKKPNNVIRLVDYQDDGRLQSVTDMLDSCLNDINKDHLSAKKAIAIFLDCDAGEYRPIWYQAGLTLDEMISLLENTKLLLQQELLDLNTD